MPEQHLATDDWAHATGTPQAIALIKHTPEDFLVDEELGFDLTGNGEHLFLRVQKRNLSTTEVARKLANTLQLRNVDVGYAGMKDRRASTTQWFSVRLPAESETKIADLENAELTVLETQRNERKLKIGTHKTNHFALRLREVRGEAKHLEEKLHYMRQYGVPNYFGKQRFGRNLSNLHQVQALMSAPAGSGKKLGRQRRSMLYSAARAYLFNQILSQRILLENWNQYVTGDVLNLNGTQRFFVVDSNGWDAELQQRLDTLDIHLTGSLSGRRDETDKYATRALAADIEDAVLAQFPDLVGGLERHGLQAGRRSLRFKPGDLNWQWHAETELALQFSLPRGAYATSLLRELCQFRDESDSNAETPEQERSQK